jgi:hypothetical protein
MVGARGDAVAGMGAAGRHTQPPDGVIQSLLVGDTACGTMHISEWNQVEQASSEQDG